MGTVQLFKGVVLVWAALAALAVSAQSSLPIGTWQIHVPNNQAVAVAEPPTSVYTATQNGLFRYLKQDNALQVLSRTNGFSDVGIKTLRYDSTTATLIIAYQNTNLDLVRDGKVINLTELLRKSMPGEKRIFHLYTHGKRAYVATSFGLVVLDLAKLEIKDTYSNLGAQGELVQVYASTVLNDSLYIASSEGLMAANLSNPNLLDFRSWRRFTAADGVPQVNGIDAYRTIAAFNGSVYAGVKGVGVVQYSRGSWQAAPFSTANQEFRSMEANGRRLVVAGPNEVVEITAVGQVTRKTDPLLQGVSMAIPAAGGGQWVASLEHGLVRVKDNAVEAFTPNGPAFVSAFRLFVEPSVYTVLGGGFTQEYLQNNSYSGFYQYQNGQWQSYTKGGGVQFPVDARDFVDAIRNPVTGKFYIASYSAGLLEWNGPEDITLFNTNNSPLLSATTGDLNYVRVTSLAVDESGSLWVVNRNQNVNAAGLFELKPDNTWVPHPINFRPGTFASTNFNRILIDELGYKWLSTSVGYSPAGIVVYDSETKQHRYLSQVDNLPSTQVYTMALDQNGEVWVGTSNGVAVFASSFDIFSSSFAGAYLPIYERRPLLDGQIVRSIAIDGGNRKWIGTDNGVWLFNETGETLIHSFTTKNSPLPSDKILDIGINHVNGEVVMATEAGIAIYRGTGTRTETLKDDCLQVFPNPVRVGYTGTIGISGLPDNGWVKITDTAGVLVFEGKAAGGTFAWNGRDYNGSRAKPGVYLVLATSADGSQTCTAKIAVQ